MRHALVISAALALASVARAQDPGVSVKDFDTKRGGTDKMHMLARVAGHTGPWKAADIELEQDPGRPYVYLCGFVNFDATCRRRRGCPGLPNSSGYHPMNGLIWWPTSTENFPKASPARSRPS